MAEWAMASMAVTTYKRIWDGIKHVNIYYNTIFGRMNIHLPDVLWRSPLCQDFESYRMFEKLGRSII